MTKHVMEVIKTEFTSVCACGGVHEPLGTAILFGERCEMYRCPGCLGLFSRPLPVRPQREDGTDVAST